MDNPHPLTAADTLEVDLEAELGEEFKQYESENQNETYQSPHAGRGSAEVTLTESLQTLQVPVEAFDDTDTHPIPQPGLGRSALAAPATLLLAIPPEMLID